jgi:hypothetical protein
MPYIFRCYIPRLFHRLTEEYKLCSSIIELHSSVITEERVLVSYSECTDKNSSSRSDLLVPSMNRNM